jgi:hypothetical protein
MQIKRAGSGRVDELNESGFENSYFRINSTFEKADFASRDSNDKSSSMFINT